tara:strand:- start:731 stop:946 length:216 start_codon:yes stop_codon:yes gene_type:complete
MSYSLENIVISNDDQKEYYLSLIERFNNEINQYEERKTLIKDKKLYNDKGYNEPRGFVYFNIEKLGDYHVE